MPATTYRRSDAGQGYDFDARAYLRAAGISSGLSALYFAGTPYQRTGRQLWIATSTLVQGLKTAGIWDKLKGLWLLCNGTEIANSFNLKSPGEFQLGFFNQPGFAPTGTSWNATAYANTYVTPLNQFTLAAGSAIGFYCRSQQRGSGASGDDVDMGALESDSFALLLSAYNPGSGGALARHLGSRVSSASSSPAGFWQSVRRSDTESVLYQNASTLAIGNSTGSLFNSYIYLGALNLPSGPYGMVQREHACAYVSDGLTTQQVLTFNTLIQQYLSARGIAV